MRYIATILAVSLGLATAVFVGCSEPPEETITIAYSNNMHGEIRSCGCGAHDYGGLGRRATWVDGLRKRSTNFLMFEGGDFFGADVNYSEQKARLTTQAMSFIGYNGIVVGEKDFSQGVDYLVERVAALKLPVVAANLVRVDTGDLLFPPSRITELPGGLKVGLIGVLGTELELPAAVPEGTLRIDAAKPAIDRELATMPDDVDLVVLLAHMPTSNARRLAGQTPEIDLVIAGHDARPSRKPKKHGNAYVLSTVDRGRFMGAAWGTLTDDGLTNLVSEVQALGADFTDHEAIVKLFQTYDIEIARVEKSRVSTGMPRGALAKAAYAGADACQSCHADTYEQWKGTTHGHAFDILVSQGREFDRDCTPCHTTGFYEMGGFASAADSPHLTHVQCEACHGNSASHSRDPKIKTPGNAKLVCRSCHNKDQTPDFEFAKYWSQIAH